MLLAEELLHLEVQLRRNLPHTCRFCHFYKCAMENGCRCHCGTVHHTIEAHIERLKAILTNSEEPSEEVSVRAVPEVVPDVASDSV